MTELRWADFPDVLSIHHVIKVYDLSRRTAWRRLAQRAIPGHLIGRAWIVYKEEVQQKLAADESTPTLPHRFLATFPEQLDVGQAAQLFGHTNTSMYQWLRTGRLDAKHAGGNAWQVSLTAARRLLADTSNQIPEFIHPSD